MKKKQITIIAVALAIVLLTGTAVYAIGNLSPESNQANNQAVQPPISAAAVSYTHLGIPF